MPTLPSPRNLWLALAVAFLGCGGRSGTGIGSTSAEVLRDVPELRGASGGYGADPAGSTAGSAGDSTPPSRGRMALPPSEFDGTETYSGRFGGPVNAPSLSPECPGWVAAQPNHVIYVSTEIPFAQLVVASDPLDTTLVVQLPDGSFRCNDDTNGLNPVVGLQPAPRGQLRVWVGSYQQGVEGDYQLTFTTDASFGRAEDTVTDVEPEE